MPTPVPNPNDFMALRVQKAYDLVRDRSEADRMLVYRALCRRLDDQCGNDDDREIVLLIRRAAEELGGMPSKDHYDAWRAGFSADERKHLPSSASLARRFKGWGGVRRLAGEPRADLTSELRRQRVVGFTQEELIAILHLYAADVPVGRIRASHVEQWCRRERARLDQRLPRIPSSAHPFYNQFGHFGAALLAVGLAERALDPPRGVVRHKRPRETPEEALIEAVRSAARDLGRPPKRERYKEWRAKARRAAALSGDPCFLPSDGTIHHRFTSWGRALVAAGLYELEEAVFVPRCSPYSESELIAAVRAAHAALPNPHISFYEQWRIDELKRRALIEDYPRLPSAMSLKVHLGGLTRSWAVVLDTALGADRLGASAVAS